MYKVSLIGVNAPDNLTIGTLTLNKGQSRDVAYLTSDLLEALSKQYITIEPPPPVLLMEAGVLDNQAGGVNTGSVVPPVTDIASAASAITVLADNQNRIVSDLSRLAAASVNLDSDIRQALSIVSKHNKTT